MWWCMQYWQFFGETRWGWAVIHCGIVWAWADEATKPLVQGRHFSWFDVGLNIEGIKVGARLMMELMEN